MRLPWILTGTLVSWGLIIAPGLIAPSLIAPGLANSISNESPGESSGEPPGLNGSYIGMGVDPANADTSLRDMMRAGHPALWLVGEMLDDSDGDTEGTDRHFQGRIDLPNSRFSLRGTVYLGRDNDVIMPNVTYDMPIGGNANIYAGAGYAFVEQNGVPTPLGDRDGVMVTTGAEAAINRHIVIYGNVGIRPNFETGLESSPVRLQLGIGHRF